MALFLAEAYIEAEEFENAFKYIDLASGSECNSLVTSLEKTGIECRIEPLILDNLRSKVNFEKKQVQQKRQEILVEEERLRKIARLAKDKVEQARKELREKERRDAEKKTERNEFWRKLGEGALTMTGRIIEAAIIGAVTYKVAEELGVDPRSISRDSSRSYARSKSNKSMKSYATFLPVNAGVNCRTDSFRTTRCSDGKIFQTDSFGTTRDNEGNSWKTDSFGTTRDNQGNSWKTDAFGTTRDNQGNSWRTDSFGTIRGSDGTTCKTDSFGTLRCE